jgi:hypothetical protein
MLSKDDLKELRIKIAPAIALAVLNGKRRELADLEELGEVQIRIEADATVPYGEMVAELERTEEEVPEKPQPQGKPRPKDRDEDTVVLGGDSPITFDAALGEDKPKPKPVEIKYDRRDAQRAALDERERLRALFESAMPAEDGIGEMEGAEPKADPAPSGKGRNRRGRGKQGSKGATSVAAAAAAAPPETPVAWVVEAPLPEPPKVTADVLASLVVPIHRPKKLGAAEPVKAAAPAPPTKVKDSEPAERQSRPQAKPRPAKAVPQVKELVPAKKETAPADAPVKGTPKTAAKAPKAEKEPKPAKAAKVVEAAPAPKPRKKASKA